MKFPSLVAVSSLLLSGLAPICAAQQALRFCFTQGVTSGVDSSGAPARIGVRIGRIGAVFVTAPVGTGPSGLAQQLLLELTQQGYGAIPDGPDCVCVLHGPGNAPIEAGGGIGSTDTGVRGVQVSLVQRPLMPPPQPGTKTNGALVPAAMPGVVATRPGQIVVDVECERVVNGQPARITVQLVVQVAQGDTQQQIDRKLETAVQRAGLRPKRAVVPQPLDPSRFHTGFLIDTDQQGNPAVGVGVVTSPGLDVIVPGPAAGPRVDFGAAQFGHGWAPIPEPPILDALTPPIIGQPFVFEVERGQPAARAFVFVSPPTPPFPLPLFDPDAFLFVDPAFELVVPGLLDPLGNGQIPLPLPPDPTLAGLDLHMQAITIAPPSPQQPLGLGLSNGLQVVPGR